MVMCHSYFLPILLVTYVTLLPHPPTVYSDWIISYCKALTFETAQSLIGPYLTAKHSHSKLLNLFRTNLHDETDMQDEEG